MQSDRRDASDPWPAAPPLPRPVFLDQFWSDTIFLHWRLPVSAAAPYMPPGVEPDVFEGSTWVGLIGFRMGGTRIGAAVPAPYFGSTTEINVRLYSKATDGSRGVVFVSLDASRLAIVHTARAFGIPYVWSRCRPSSTGAAQTYGYDVERYRGQATSSFVVRADTASQADDRLSLELTARFGLHARIAGRTFFIPNSHRPWPLHPASLVKLEDELVRAAGFDVEGPPESVLFSPGVRTLFGRPRSIPAP